MQQEDVHGLGGPMFPDFKFLEMEDRDLVEHLTRPFPPYSDFNFVSMWSWDTYKLCRLSTLHGNLVVRFTDYITGDPFYSFIGRNKVNDTVLTLFEYMEDQGLPPRLKLMPEMVAHSVSLRDLSFELDDSNYDYVLPVERLKELAGSEFSNKRWRVSQFTRRFDPTFVPLNLRSQSVQARILDVFDRWARFRGIENPREENEYQALCRLLMASENFRNLVSFGTFVQDRMVGFVIAEDLRNGYAIGHFTKADIALHSGIYTYMVQQIAGALRERGCVQINTEQDLGHKGLRENKSSYGPLNHLRKYVISPSRVSTERETLEPPRAALVLGSIAPGGPLSLQPPRLNVDRWLESIQPPPPDESASAPAETSRTSSRPPGHEQDP